MEPWSICQLHEWRKLRNSSEACEKKNNHQNTLTRTCSLFGRRKIDVLRTWRRSSSTAYLRMCNVQVPTNNLEANRPPVRTVILNVCRELCHLTPFPMIKRTFGAVKDFFSHISNAEGFSYYVATIERRHTNRFRIEHIMFFFFFRFSNWIQIGNWFSKIQRRKLNRMKVAAVWWWLVLVDWMDYSRCWKGEHSISNRALSVVYCDGHLCCSPPSWLTLTQQLACNWISVDCQRAPQWVNFTTRHPWVSVMPHAIACEWWMRACRRYEPYDILPTCRNFHLCMERNFSTTACYRVGRLHWWSARDTHEHLFLFDGNFPCEASPGSRTTNTVNRIVFNSYDDNNIWSHNISND